MILGIFIRMQKALKFSISYLRISNYCVLLTTNIKMGAVGVECMQTLLLPSGEVERLFSIDPRLK